MGVKWQVMCKLRKRMFVVDGLYGGFFLLWRAYPCRCSIRIAFAGIVSLSVSLVQSLRKIISANDGGEADLASARTFSVMILSISWYGLSMHFRYTGRSITIL